MMRPKPKKSLPTAPFFTNNMLINQLIGSSNLLDWVVASSQLPSDYTRHSRDASDAFALQWKEKPAYEKFIHLIEAMPPVGRLGTFWGLYPAEWVVAPLWLFNLIFGHIANMLGFTLKAMGDFLAYWGSLPVVYIYKRFSKSIKRSFRQNGGAGIVWAALMLLVLLPLWLPLAAIVVIPVGVLWILAQPLHLLSNTIHYLRFLVDGITSVAVWLASWVTRLFGDISPRPKLFYSLGVIATSLLFLAPIALLIAFSIVPFAGPVGAFLGSVVLNVSFTSAAGAINLAILFGLTVGLQASAAAFTAVVNFIKPRLRRLINHLWQSNDVSYTLVPFAPGALPGTGQSGMRQGLGTERSAHDKFAEKVIKKTDTMEAKVIQKQNIIGGVEWNVRVAAYKDHVLNNTRFHIYIPARYAVREQDYCLAFLSGYHGAQAWGDRTNLVSADDLYQTAYTAGMAQHTREKLVKDFINDVPVELKPSKPTSDIYNQGYYAGLFAKKSYCQGLGSTQEESYREGYQAGLAKRKLPAHAAAIAGLDRVVTERSTASLRGVPSVPNASAAATGTTGVPSPASSRL